MLGLSNKHSTDLTKKIHVKMCTELIIRSGEISRTRHELCGFTIRVLRIYFKLFKEALIYGVS
jgi:hypothetical protein